MTANNPASKALSTDDVRAVARGGFRARLIALHRAASRLGYVIMSLDAEPGYREVCLESLDRGLKLRVWETNRADGAWFACVDHIEHVVVVSGADHDVAGGLLFPSQRGVRTPARRVWHSTVLRGADGKAAMRPIDALRSLGEYLEDNPRKLLEGGSEKRLDEVEKRC